MSVLRKVEALMRKTVESGATPEEAESAFIMASKLLSDNDLTFDDLKSADFDAKGRTDNAEYHSVEWSFSSKRVTYWKGTLAMIICENLVKNCSVVLTTLNDPFTGLSKGIKFYGLKESVETAYQTFLDWEEYIVNSSMSLYGSSQRGDGNSYCLGFVTGLHRALQSQERERKLLATQTQGLVIRNAIQLHNAHLEKAKQALGFNVTRGSKGSGAKIKKSAYALGLSNGQSASLTKKVR